MKILIIDDEIAVLTKLKAILSDYGDCIMTTDADQGLRLFQTAIESQSPFELVLIDIQLAQASGLDLLAAMIDMEIQSKASHALKMMVSASGTKANLVKAFTRGCDGFLVKPVKRDVLIEKLGSLGIHKKQGVPDPPSSPETLSQGDSALEDLPGMASADEATPLQGTADPGPPDAPAAPEPEVEP